MRLIIHCTRLRFINRWWLAVFFLCSHAVLGQTSQQVERLNKEIFSCDEALVDTVRFSKLNSMLLQVGLYFVNDKYQQSHQVPDNEYLQLTDADAQHITKVKLAEFCQSLPLSDKQDVVTALFSSQAFIGKAIDCQLFPNLNEVISRLKSNPQISQTGLLKLLQTCPSLNIIDTDYFMLTAENVQTLQSVTLLQYPKIDIDGVATKLLDNVNQPFMNYQIFNSFVKDTIEEIKDYPQLQFDIAQQARKSILADNTPLFQYVSDCECVKALYFETHNYHIYPAKIPWQQLVELPVSEDKTPVPIIQFDYSFMARLAYQGIAIDRDGKLLWNGWKKQREAFITEAHKHYTKVDLVINIDHWLQHKPQEVQSQRRRVVDEVLSGSPSAIEQVAGLGDNLDGITLSFSNIMPNLDSPSSMAVQAEDAAVKLSTYVEEFLKIKNSESLQSLKVNLLLDLAGCLDDAQCVEGFAKPLFQKLDFCPDSVMDPVTKERCHEQHKSIDFILVSMPHSIRSANLTLIDIITHAYKGNTRGKILLKTLPILQTNKYSGESIPIFNDAVNFGKDMFGGNAYWPAPITGYAEFESVSDVIKTVTFDPDNEAIAHKIVVQIEQATGVGICKFVCAERGYFGAGFMVYLTFLVSLIYMKGESCLLCSLIEQHFKKYVSLWVVAFITFVIWLGCDPMWRGIQEQALLVWTAVFFFALIFKSYANRTKYTP